MRYCRRLPGPARAQISSPATTVPRSGLYVLYMSHPFPTPGNHSTSTARPQHVHSTFTARHPTFRIPMNALQHLQQGSISARCYPCDEVLPKARSVVRTSPTRQVFVYRWLSQTPHRLLTDSSTKMGDIYLHSKTMCRSHYAWDGPFRVRLGFHPLQRMLPKCWAMLTSARQRPSVEVRRVEPPK